MVLPIYVYGTSVLREETEDVEQDSPELQQLIDDMLETMHAAAGIGLAAPQVGRRERIFVVDLTPMVEDLQEEQPDVELPEQPMVFVNPDLVWESEESCEYEEGCLSIPDLREYVERPERIRIAYQGRHLEPREVEVGGWLARVIQHEYDHLEGILFVDRISPFRRRLLRRRLREMARGEVEAEYPLHTADSPA